MTMEEATLKWRLPYHEDLQKKTFDFMGLEPDELSKGDLIVIIIWLQEKFVESKISSGVTVKDKE